MRNNVNWVAIQAEWAAGTPTRKTAAKHGVSISTINRRVRRENWLPITRKLKQAMVKGVTVEAESRPNVDPSKGNGIKTIGKGRSIGQPIGDLHKDTELLSEFASAAQLSAPDAEAVIEQAATEIELLRQHRGIISRASVVAENILTRLHALVVEGTAADVITFETKKGEAYHRVPFLGDRESVSDALIKCANAISKLIPLERQAHGLVDEKHDVRLPTVVFNMPNIRIISVDGRGKVVSHEDRPALIEHDAAPTDEA